MSEERVKRNWSEVQRRAKHQLNIRFTDEEWAAIEERSSAIHVPAPTYVKAVALGQPVPRRSSRYVEADTAAIAQMNAQLGKLGSNANQIARACNLLTRIAASGEKVEPIELRKTLASSDAVLLQINNQLQEFRAQIMDALNLDP